MSKETPFRSSQREASKTEALDRLFETLGRSPRRQIVTAFADADSGPEAEIDIAEFVDDEKRDASLASLYHVHLPSLDDANVIEWDRATGTVRRGPRYDEIEPVVELLIEHRDVLPGDWP